MKIVLWTSLLLMASTHAALAQFGGGASGNAGGFAGNSSAYGNTGSTPAQIERSKRLIYSDSKDTTYIEGSILMNVKADEYVAVFAVMTEGKTPGDANLEMDTAIGNFRKSLQALGIQDADVFVDFVTQNRVYEYRLQENVAREELAGFELKKNISIHFQDKLLVDRLVSVAAESQIFDLVKVDYVIKDAAAIQARLQTQTLEIVKRKAAIYQSQLGIPLTSPVQIMLDKPSIYYPMEQYSSYTAAESENISVAYDRNRYTVQNARKSRTTYFNPLSGNDFDTVINPVIIEPVVQFTTYLRVRYATGKPPKKRR